MQRNPVLANDLFKSKGNVANSMTNRASVHTGSATEQIVHRNKTFTLVHTVPEHILETERSRAKSYPVQCEHDLNKHTDEL